MHFTNSKFSNKGIVIILFIAAVGVIAGAGYYGFKTSQAQTEPPVQAPPTVPVSRGEVKLTITAPGQSVNASETTLQSHVSASVQEILVHPGDAVKAGQTLMHLGDRETFTSAITQARIQVMQAQKTLDSLGDNASSLAQAQLNLANAQKALDDAKRKRDKMNYPHSSDKLVIEKAETDYLLAKAKYKDALQAYNLVDHKKLTDPERVNALNNLVSAEADMKKKFATYNWYLLNYTPSDIAQADGELAVAQANFDKAQADFDKLENGINPDRELAETQLANAQAELQQAEANLKNLDITAPFDGIVTNVMVDNAQGVAPGASLLTMIDPAAMDVEATVVEEDLPLVQVGQKVQLYFDALPDSDATGTVSRIIPQRVANSSQANYTIVISLDHPIDHLAAGMTVDGSIVISQKMDVLRLPRSVVHAQPDGNAVVQVWANGQLTQRTIHVGLKGDSYTEVLDGLDEGEQVVAR